VSRPDYPIPVDEAGVYKEVLTSDEYRFGGKGLVNEKPIKSKCSNSNKQNYIEINLPALSGVIIRKTNGKIRRG
jgi:1,4-alpha-glucan branching enzyme